MARALASATVKRALASSDRVGLFAAGKAAAAMARAARAHLGSRAPALVVLPRGHSASGLPRRAVAFAAHPEPDASSLRAGRRAFRFFRSFGREDTILCLLSGGASSLLAVPREGVTLAQKRRLIRELARTGAPIDVLNRLRTKLSAIKGGRLGRSTAARLVTLVLSDVPGDRASLVGSGPTVRGRRRDLVRVVGSNRSGLEAAAREARRIGLKPVLEPRRDHGRGRAGGTAAGAPRGHAAPGLGPPGRGRDDGLAEERHAGRPRRHDASSSRWEPRRRSTTIVRSPSGRGLGRPRRQLGGGGSLRRRLDGSSRPRPRDRARRRTGPARHAPAVRGPGGPLRDGADGYERGRLGLFATGVTAARRGGTRLKPL